MSKKEKERRVPKLRFKGFTDDWIQYKGEEIFQRRNETTNESEKFRLDIGLENLVSNSGIVVGDTHLRTNSNSVFQKEDTLFGRLRPYLNKWWYATEAGIKSGEIWSIYATDKTSPLFIYYLIQTERFLYYANISAGTRMPRASWNTISEKLFFISTLKEQNKIGEILDKLEKIITLEQEKLEVFLELKLVTLRKIYATQSNLNMDSSKLKHYITKKGKINKDNKEYTVSSVTNKEGFVNQNRQFENTHLNNLNKNTYRVVDSKDFAYNPSRINVGSIGYNDTESKLLVSPLYVVFKAKPSLNDRYFYYYTQTEMFLYEVSRNTEGSVRQSLSFENMGNINIPVPKNDESQLLIAQYFMKLDTIIFNTQQQVNNYHRIKKYLLNNLFV